jgi:hypothetical protein
VAAIRSRSLRMSAGTSNIAPRGKMHALRQPLEAQLQIRRSSEKGFVHSHRNSSTIRR